MKRKSLLIIFIVPLLLAGCQASKGYKRYADHGIISFERPKIYAEFDNKIRFIGSDIESGSGNPEIKAMGSTPYFNQTYAFALTDDTSSIDKAILIEVDELRKRRTKWTDNIFGLMSSKTEQMKIDGKMHQSFITFENLPNKYQEIAARKRLLADEQYLCWTAGRKFNDSIMYIIKYCETDYRLPKNWDKTTPFSEEQKKVARQIDLRADQFFQSIKLSD